jgi:hypothetical protein
MELAVSVLDLLAIQAVAMLLQWHHSSAQVIPTSEITKAADATQDSADFLLALLATCAPGHIRLLGSTMHSFKIGFYKHSAAELAADEPVIAALVATGHERGGLFTGRMEAVARRAGVPPDAVQHALQRLAAKGQVHLEAGQEQAAAIAVAGRPAAGVRALAKVVHARLAALQQRMVRALSACFMCRVLSRALLCAQQQLRNQMHPIVHFHMCTVQAQVEVKHLCRDDVSNLQVHKLELVYRIMAASLDCDASERSAFLQACIRGHFAGPASEHVGAEAQAGQACADASGTEDQLWAQLPAEVQGVTLPFDQEPGEMTRIQVRASSV